MWKCPKCGREFSKTNQDHYCIKPQTIDDYIAAQEESIRPRLEQLLLRRSWPILKSVKERSGFRMTGIYRRR